MTTIHIRSDAEQLLIEQAALWFDRWDAVRAAVSGAELSDQGVRGQLARGAALSVAEGWSVLYLLALVRQLDPDTADRAARYLHLHAAALTPWMCERLVQRWRDGAEDGTPTTVPLD